MHSKVSTTGTGTRPLQPGATLVRCPVGLTLALQRRVLLRRALLQLNVHVSYALHGTGSAGNSGCGK